MQSVQIIPTLSFVLAGSAAEPAATDGGFGLAFDEEPEMKADSVVGSDAAALPGPVIPTWFDITALKPGIAGTVSGLTGAAPAGTLEPPPSKAASAAETAEPAVGNGVAAPRTSPSVVMPTVLLQDIAAASGSAIPLEAAWPIAAAPDSGPRVTGAQAYRPEAEATGQAASAAPTVAEDFAEPSVPGPEGEKTPVEAGPSGPPNQPAANAAAAAGSVGIPGNDASDGTSAAGQAPGPDESRPTVAGELGLAKGLHPAAVAGPDKFAPVDLGSGGTARAAGALDVGRLAPSESEAPAADIRKPVAMRSGPVLVGATEGVHDPIVAMTPHPAPGDTAEPAARTTEKAPPLAPAALPGPDGTESIRAAGQLLLPDHPVPSPVEKALQGAGPDADGPKGLLPGVWERLFTGILAPVLHPADGLRAVQSIFPSLTGQMPAEAAPADSDDAAADPKTTAGEAQPPSGADHRRAPVAGPAGVPASWASEPAFDPALTPDIVPDPAGDGGAAPGGLAGPITSSGPVVASLGAVSALPVPQVAAQISAALSKLADGSTELALAPEELGKVRLKLKPDAAHPDRMVVMITFERPETLDLFRKHAGELADALRAAGYSGADIGFGQEGGTASGSDRHDRPAPPAQDTGFKSDLPGIAPTAARLPAGASLDLRL